MTALTQAQRIAALDLIVPADDPEFVLDQVRSMFQEPDKMATEVALLTMLQQALIFGGMVEMEAFFEGARPVLIPIFESEDGYRYEGDGDADDRII